MLGRAEGVKLGKNVRGIMYKTVLFEDSETFIDACTTAVSQEDFVAGHLP